MRHRSIPRLFGIFKRFRVNFINHWVDMVLVVDLSFVNVALLRDSNSRIISVITTFEVLTSSSHYHGNSIKELIL